MKRKWWIEKTKLGFGVMKSYPPIRKETVIRPSLQDCIASGEADPISDRERQQLEELRQEFIKRFGYDPEEEND